jgi:hypothetical protein
MLPSEKYAKEHYLLSRKAITDELTATGKQLNSAQADFLRLDAQTARTFIDLALQTNDLGKKERNCKNARKAYDTILRLWNNVAFTSTQEAYMHEMMGRLKTDLEQLGERF